MRTIAAIIALVVSAHVGLWALTEPGADAPEVVGRLSSVSYAPFARSAHPDRGDRPTTEQIRTDLEALAPYTRAVRTYSSTGGVRTRRPRSRPTSTSKSPRRWIDKDQDRNDRELKSAAIELARNNSNVNAIVVGNETIYRARIKVDELIKIIRQVKKQSPGRSPPAKSGQRLARPSETGVARRLHRRPHPAVLGRLSDTQTVNQTIDHLRASCAGPIRASAS